MYSIARGKAERHEISFFRKREDDDDLRSDGPFVDRFRRSSRFEFDRDVDEAITRNKRGDTGKPSHQKDLDYRVDGQVHDSVHENIGAHLYNPNLTQRMHFQQVLLASDERLQLLLVELAHCELIGPASQIFLASGEEIAGVGNRRLLDVLEASEGKGVRREGRNPLSTNALFGCDL